MGNVDIDAGFPLLKGEYVSQSNPINKITNRTKKTYSKEKGQKGAKAVKIENYIRIDGKYVRQEEIPEEKMKEISRTLMLRLAEGFGYVPVTEEEGEP